jgi:hypothetical protein
MNELKQVLDEYIITLALLTKHNLQNTDYGDYVRKEINAISKIIIGVG